MKRYIIFIFIMFVMTISSNAQTTNKYLTVKGVELKPGLEMDYLLNQFLAKGLTKQINFSEYYAQTGIYTLSGTFNNVPGCVIQILPCDDDKTKVGKIGIVFPDNETFNSLYEQYNDLKQSLKQKYYLFEETDTFFDDFVAKSNSSNLKMRAIKKDECKFLSRFWHSKEDVGINGEVMLRIGYLEVNYSEHYQVYLVYFTPSYVSNMKNTDDL